MMETSRRTHRFPTIVGLLGLVLVIGGGIWLILPARTSDCRVSTRSQAANNLRQIGLGLAQYVNTYHSYPPGALFDRRGIPLHGWPTLILPYTDEVDLYNALNFARPWDDPTPGPPDRTSNQALTSTGIGIYRNPGAPAPPGIMGYASNAWVLGGLTSRRPSSITDGLAQTIFAGEAAGNYQRWGSPVHWRDPNLGINRSPQGFGGPFPGGAHFLFGDFSVRFLRNGTPQPLFRALCTPSGQEPVDPADLDSTQ